MTTKEKTILRLGGRASLIAQLVKNTPAMQEILVQFLGQQDPLGRLPTPVFLGFPWNTAGKFWPGEFNELYSPWSRKESDMAMQLSLSFTFGLEEKKVNGWGGCVCVRGKEKIFSCTPSTNHNLA